MNGFPIIIGIFFLFLNVSAIAETKKSPLPNSGPTSRPTSGNEPLLAAADYYFRNHDYNQAFQIVTELHRRNPEDFPVLLQLMDLTLLIQGRQSLHDFAMPYWEQRSTSLTPEERRKFRDHFSTLQNTFLLEDALSLSQQAAVKTRHKDWAGALSLLQRALSLEPGNTTLLTQKAEVEKFAGQLAAYYDTLKLRLDANPFQWDAILDLAEAHLFNRNPKEALSLLRREPEKIKFPREKLTLALALFESDLTPESVKILKTMAESDRETHPATFLILAKIASQKKENRKETLHYYELAFRQANQKPLWLTEGWDPYRLNEKMDEAKKTYALLQNETLRPNTP